MAGSSLDALVGELMSNPEKALTVDLSDEDLLALQRRIDPYARIAGPGTGPAEQVKVAAASYTNLSEDYIRRFTMTGMIAFIWRMFDEWTVDATDRRWKPAKAKGERAPFTTTDLEQRVDALKGLVEALKEAELDFETAKKIAQEYNEKELTFSAEEMKAANEAAKASETGRTDTVFTKMQNMQALLDATKMADDRFQGLRYAITLEMRNMGLEADLRISETEKVAMQHPKSRRIIQEEPNRYRGLLPGGQQEMPETRAKGLIKAFISNLFEYNPDAHVRKAYDEMVVDVKRTTIEGLTEQVLVDPTDPQRIPLQTLLAEKAPTSTVALDQEPLKAILGARTVLEQQRDYNTLCRLLHEPRIADVARYMLAAPEDDGDRLERWRRMLLPTLAADVIPVIPPQDTHHRFNYYLEVNMEAIREATNSIYHDKPGLDFALHLMDSTTGTQEEVDEWGERFRDANQDNVISGIKLIRFGGWTLLGDFERNREKANIYNRHTDILAKILRRHEEDQKFGELMMRQRVRKAKAENIAQEGPDAPGLGDYKAQHPVRGATEALTAVERRRLERAQGNLKVARELEYYETHEKRVKELEQAARLRELTMDEQRELKDSLEEMKKAEEMLDVPDDAIQVDVWSMNPKEGTAAKTKFYTKATTATAQEDEQLSAENDARAAAIAAAGSIKPRPEDFYPEGSRDLARAAFAAGKTAPDLAPFAQDFLAKDLARERAVQAEDEAAVKAEAQARLTGPESAAGADADADASPPDAPAAGLTAGIDSALDAIIEARKATKE
jgi:hypothetical protein